MRSEQILKADSFLEEINKIQLDRKMSWVAKNTEILKLISIRDKLMKEKNLECFPVFAEYSSAFESQYIVLNSN